MSESGGSKLVVALAAGASAAAAVAAAFALSRQSDDEDNQARSKGRVSQSKPSSASSWFPSLGFGASVAAPSRPAAPAPIAIDRLTQSDFEENTPYEAIKVGSRGYDVAAYRRTGIGSAASSTSGRTKGNTSVVSQGAFARMSPKLIYNCFRFLQLHDVARVTGVCPSWRNFCKLVLSDRDFLKDCASQGFDTRCRGYCWKLLAGAPTLTNKKADMVTTLAEQKSRHREDIQRDVTRTLIHYSAFETQQEAVDTLTKILVAYSVHDAEVGYTQGMNFIAAFLLTELPPQEAYWLYYSLMVSQRYRIRGLFIHGLPFLKLCQYQFQRLFEWFLPKLARRFESMQITCELYATEWFMTLFTYRSIPAPTSARIWNLFLIDGWKALHRVGLAILFLSQETLMELDFEGTIQYLKFFPDQGIFNGDLLLREALNFKVTNRLLHRLMQVYKGDALYSL